MFSEKESMPNAFAQQRTAAQTGIGQLDQACNANPGRDKYWKELSIEEKIERMRQVVKQQASEARALRRFVSTVMYRVERLETHSHGVTGGVLIPVGNCSNGYGYAECDEKSPLAPPSDPDAVYF